MSSLFMPADAAWYVHLFLDATLATRSVGITARVLKDIGRTDAPESQVILGAAVVDDILGLIVLAIVLGLVQSPADGAAAFALAPIAVTVLKAAGFLTGAIVRGRLVIVPLITLVHRARSPSVPLDLSVAYCSAMAALANQLGLPTSRARSPTGW